MNDSFERAAGILDIGDVSARFGHLEIVSRDHLVSVMLQDRDSLRLLSAPSGYGKSVLAFEYARRIFPTGSVCWVDAQSSTFLSNLDSGFMLGLDAANRECDLVVIDSLPYLDEQRASLLISSIDALLEQDIEVVVTTVPTHDCLRSCEMGRTLIGAAELQVTQEECCARVQDPEELSRAKEGWFYMERSFMGTVPAVFWGAPARVRDCLTSFFRENLPLETLKAAFCMMLLGNGDFDDLDNLGLRVRTETENLLIHDYPFLSIEPVLRKFEQSALDFAELACAIGAAGMADSLAKGSFPLPEKVMGYLLNAGRAERAAQIMDAFCSEERCAAWLIQSGWMLMDKEEFNLLEALLNRCSDELLMSEPPYNALRGWFSGLRGERREAVYYAKRAIRAAQGRGVQSTETDAVQMMAQLALLAFDGEQNAFFAKERYAADTIDSAMDFLAAVVDACTPLELARALAIHPSNLSRQLERRREDASDERASVLVGLVTQYEARCNETYQYRLAVHLLHFVDSQDVKTTLQEIDYDQLIRLRRQGVKSVLEALLVVDMWRMGLFGVSARSANINDLRVMSEASALLEKLNAHAPNEEPAPIPWEVGALPGNAGQMPVKKQKKSNIALEERVAPLTVRLFGNFEVLLGERYIPEQAWRKKALQLFVMLVLEQGRDVMRDYLFEQLWPGSSRTRALDNFYTLWSVVVRTLDGGPYIERKGEFCRINHRYVQSDVAEFEHLSKRLLMERNDTSVLLDIYARLEQLYRGGLLPSEQKNKMVIARREHYSAIYVDAMIAASAKSIEAKDVRVALWFARKAYVEDPRREDVYYALISSQMAAGQRTTAIRTFFQCKEYLRDELGLDPSYDLQSLYDELIEVDPSLLSLTPQTFK